MYKVELTTDGKVSIPVEIRELLDLHSGESLVFYASKDGKDKKVEILKEDKITECPVCLGEGSLIKKFYSCFACEQQGVVLYYQSVKEAVFRIRYIKHRIEMTMLEQVISLDRVGSISIPILLLSSAYYPKKIILEGQKRLQKLLIEEALSKNKAIKEYSLIELNQIVKEMLKY